MITINKNHKREAIKTVAKYILFTSFALGFFGTPNAFSDPITLTVSGAPVICKQQADDPNNPGAAVIKDGSGDYFSLSSLNTGHTTILAGRWFTKGTHGVSGATTTVAAKSTFAGSGPILNDIENRGTLSPSAGGVTAVSGAVDASISIGTTMTISGNLTNQDGSIIALYCGATAADRINLGTSSFNGTNSISIIPVPGHYSSTPATYTILTWEGTITGTMPPPTINNVSNLDLNATITPIINGYTLTIAGIDKTLNAGTTSIADVITATGSVTVPPNAVIANTSGTQTIATQLAFQDDSTIQTTSGAETVISQPISSAPGKTLSLTGGGATTLAGDNSTLQSNIAVSSSTVNVASGSNIGTGELTLASATLNLDNGSSLQNTVTTDSTTIINIQPTTTPIIVSGSLAGEGTVAVTSGGTAVFSAPNTNLSGPVQISSATAQIADGANLGTGPLSLASTGDTAPTVVMGNVTLPNPISVNAAATFTSSPDKTAVLSGEIIGASPLTFSGAGTTNLTGDSPSFSGSFNVTGGAIAVNSNFSNAAISIGNGATLSGSGAVGDVTLQPGSLVGSGNSSSTRFYAQAWSNTGTIYTVNVNRTGGANTIVVSGNTTLENPIFNVQMDNGNVFSRGVINYNVFQTTGTLTVTGPVTINWVNPASGNNGVASPIALTLGTFSKTTNGVLTNYLVLKATLTDDVTIRSAQTVVDGSNGTITIPSPLPSITIDTNDVVSADSGLLPDASPTVAPVAKDVELPDLVFPKTDSGEIISAAKDDSFRFKGFSSGITPSVSGKKIPWKPYSLPFQKMALSAMNGMKHAFGLHLL